MSRIEMKDVFFSYSDGANVLKGINLTFNDQATAIVGQNGAGKTTLVKLLKGLLEPDKGEILLDGAAISTATVAEIAAQIGLVFQNPNDQIFKNKVIDEVMFGPLNIGLSHKEAQKHAQDALGKLKLAGYENENPYDLSLSERKMITIASILAMDTDVIIFDEPTMGQDYIGKILIKSIIAELQQAGKLVLCILHDMDFAADVFERTLVFNQGKLLLDGPTAAIFANEAVLKEAHLEQPQVVQIARHLGLQQTPLNEEDLIVLLKAARSGAVPGSVE